MKNFDCQILQKVRQFAERVCVVSLGEQKVDQVDEMNFAILQKNLNFICYKDTLRTSYIIRTDVGAQTFPHQTAVRQKFFVNSFVKCAVILLECRSLG